MAVTALNLTKRSTCVVPCPPPQPLFAWEVHVHVGMCYVTCGKGTCSKHLISLLPPKQRRKGGVSLPAVSIMHLHHKGWATNGGKETSLHHFKVSGLHTLWTGSSLIPRPLILLLSDLGMRLGVTHWRYSTSRCWSRVPSRITCESSQLM